MIYPIHQKYGLNPPHSEVIEACRQIKPCYTLDMGCGNGRNALYLNELGFQVRAIDSNPTAIQSLSSIIEAEGVEHIQPELYDIHQADLKDTFGFVVCTVTLMFLDPGRVKSVIQNMQLCTEEGGYHLIVCAMHTEKHPCPVPFPFTLAEDELRTYYKDWDLIKYNEDLGTMHNGAQLQFATLLARKPIS